MKRIHSFTLVEILTAVAIIAILAGISVGVSSYVHSKNNEVQTTATIKLLEMALEQYKNKFGSYPVLNETPNANIGNPVFRIANTQTDLSKCFTDVEYDGNTVKGIKGMKLVSDSSHLIVVDGWGTPIVYLYPGVFNKTKYDLGSLGQDKTIGDDTTESKKITGTGFSNLGNRTSGAYKDSFGKVDDITNFKR